MGWQKVTLIFLIASFLGIGPGTLMSLIPVFLSRKRLQLNLPVRRPLSVDIAADIAVVTQPSPVAPPPQLVRWLQHSCVPW